MDDPDENAGDEPPPGNVKKKNLTGGRSNRLFLSFCYWSKRAMKITRSNI
jgi:hypothetical protein